jgi:hypothetical protein
MGGTRARKALHARGACHTKECSRTSCLTLCELLRASKRRYIFQRAYRTRSADGKQKSRLVLAARAGRAVLFLLSRRRRVETCPWQFPRRKLAGRELGLAETSAKRSILGSNRTPEISLTRIQF